MTTKDEVSPVYNFVLKKLNAIDQENNSSSSHSLSIPCIYKVPEELRKLNERAYNPRVVSIGPIHNNNKKKDDDDGDDDDKGEQHLQATEHIKVASTKELAYNPRVVSIGPIHNKNKKKKDDDDDDDDDREEQHLKATEYIKEAYTKHLLYRVAAKLPSTEKKMNSMGDTLKECSKAMLDSEDSALNCYAENLKPIIKKKIDQHRLAQMFLIDGCFILELLYRSYLIRKREDQDDPRLVKTEDRNTQDDPQDDPLFGKTVIMSGVRHDLLLLENQLPFFILKELFHKTIERIPNHPESSCPSLTKLVLSFFGNVMNFSDNRITTNLKEDECFHILHLLHSCYQPSSPSPDKKEDYCFHILDLIHSCYQPGSPSRNPKRSHFSRRASDLDCAGVKFVAGTGKDQFDIHFKEASGLLRCCRSAKFEIPPLSIYDCTEPFLRNLIAFEQCCPSIERHITSYAFLMDLLIDSAADVKLLEKAEIINNYLGASEDALVLINNICKHAVLGQFHFAKPCNDAESYCKRRWPGFRALLKRDYFSNPWSIIAFVPAFILFAIAVVQTVYALLTYYGVEYETVRELHDMHSVL